ncbi:MAG: SAM-dependent methyltransferase [Candidatus Cloacimonetes bacterium]|nr:SAM-dependent methyltransferase [Candidatus Cloacimonadota bacterium]
MNRQEFKIFPIGKVRRDESGIRLEIGGEFKDGLLELEKFSHVIVLWWAHGHDNEEDRKIMETALPYAENTRAGVFACRAEYRPNPIAVTVCPISDIDQNKGIINIKGIDAIDYSPILDLKPYIPVCDRVDDFTIPKWFTGWPTCLPEKGLQLEYD